MKQKKILTFKPFVSTCCKGGFKDVCELDFIGDKKPSKGSTCHHECLLCGQSCDIEKFKKPKNNKQNKYWEKIKKEIMKVIKADVMVSYGKIINYEQAAIDIVYIIQDLLKTQNQSIIKIVEGITLNKKQSTKIFAGIEKSYQALIKNSKYSAPEVIKLKMKEFWWNIYIGGRIDEKQDIIKELNKDE